MKCQNSFNFFQLFPEIYQGLYESAQGIPGQIFSLEGIPAQTRGLQMAGFFRTGNPCPEKRFKNLQIYSAGIPSYKKISVKDHLPRIYEYLRLG